MIKRSIFLLYRKYSLDSVFSTLNFGRVENKATILGNTASLLLEQFYLFENLLTKIIDQLIVVVENMNLMISILTLFERIL